MPDRQSVSECNQKKTAHPIARCAAFLLLSIATSSVIIYLLPFEFTTRVLSGDSEPKVATTIDHETMTSRYVQTRERGTVGIVAGGVDSIARTVHLGREGHITQIIAADGYAGDKIGRASCRERVFRAV